MWNLTMTNGHKKSPLYFNYKDINDQHPKISPTNQDYKQFFYWFISPIKYLIMMKLWFPFRHLLNFINSNRTIPRHTLFIRHNNFLFIHNPYFLRCKLWMNYPISNCHGSIHIFICLFILTG